MSAEFQAENAFMLMACLRCVMRCHSKMMLKSILHLDNIHIQLGRGLVKVKYTSWNPAIGISL
jgi:hypothetical protein